LGTTSSVCPTFFSISMIMSCVHWVWIRPDVFAEQAQAYLMHQTRVNSLGKDRACCLCCWTSSSISAIQLLVYSAWIN